MIAVYALVVAILILLIVKLYKRNESFDNQTVVTLYYTDSCPWCQQFKPTWDALKNNLIPKGVKFQDVDTARTPVNGIPGVPTVIMQKNGKSLRFAGDRTFDNLITWISTA